MILLFLKNKKIGISSPRFLPACRPSRCVGAFPCTCSEPCCLLWSRRGRRPGPVCNLLVPGRQQDDASRLPQGAPGKSELRCPRSHEPRCDPPQPQGSRQREQSRGHEFLPHLRPQHKEGCGLLRIAGVPREASCPCPELQLTLRCPPGRIPMTPAEPSRGARWAQPLAGSDGAAPAPRPIGARG